jgi:hypothetical protein
VLDDLIPADRVCRVIGAFVLTLDMEVLGFVRAQAADTGRPGYAPRDLLKLYLYGYLNQIRSSRRLEECVHHRSPPDGYNRDGTGAVVNVASGSEAMEDTEQWIELFVAERTLTYIRPWGSIRKRIRSKCYGRAGKQAVGLRLCSTFKNPLHPLQAGALRRAQFPAGWGPRGSNNTPVLAPWISYGRIQSHTRRTISATGLH